MFPHIDSFMASPGSIPTLLTVSLVLQQLCLCWTATKLIAALLAGWVRRMSPESFCVSETFFSVLITSAQKENLKGNTAQAVFWMSNDTIFNHVNGFSLLSTKMVILTVPSAEPADPAVFIAFLQWIKSSVEWVAVKCKMIPFGQNICFVLKVALAAG